MLKLDDENSHWLKDFYLELENFNSNLVINILPLGSEEKTAATTLTSKETRVQLLRCLLGHGLQLTDDR